MTWLLTFSFIFAASQEFEKKTIKFENGKELKVEVADSIFKRNQGLMNRTSLGENEGMLFVFNNPQKLSFWMKNTFIPLSIAYVDESKEIKEIHHMKAQNMMERNQDLRGYPSQCECQYAIEVNDGWFKKNKVKVGQKFDFVAVPSKKGPAQPQSLSPTDLPK